MIERISRASQITSIEVNDRGIDECVLMQRVIVNFMVMAGIPERIKYQGRVTLSIDQAQQLQHELQKSIEYYEKESNQRL